MFGVGGLGYAAIQLAIALGVERVFAVDINPDNLKKAVASGAEAINAADVNPVDALFDKTRGKGVDVALELVGIPVTTRQALLSVAIQGRAMLVGIGNEPFEVFAYNEVLNKEAEIIGVSDHLASELPELLALLREGKISLSGAVSRTIPLDSTVINATLDHLERSIGEVRVIIAPGG